MRLIKTRIPLLAALTALLAAPWGATIANGQSLEHRIETLRAEQQAQRKTAPPTIDVAGALNLLIERVRMNQMPAQDAFQWWAKRTGVPLVIDWRAMERNAVAPDAPITLELDAVPAEQCLRILMQQASPDVELIHQVTPWYVQVMTKREANRHTVVRIYDVGDLVMPIPNFSNAPEFRLDRIIEEAQSDGEYNSGSLFDEGDSDQREADRDAQAATRDEQGESLADLVRETVEPGIWQEAGGGIASVRYFDNRLIVRAPLYVHQQIGQPAVDPAERPQPIDPDRIDTNAHVDTTRKTGGGGIGPPSRPAAGVLPD